MTIALTVVTVRGGRHVLAVKRDDSVIVRNVLLAAAKSSAMGATFELDAPHGRQLVDALCEMLDYWPAAPSGERRHLFEVDPARRDVPFPPCSCGFIHSDPAPGSHHEFTCPRYKAAGT